MTYKHRRQARIMDLIKNNIVGTQEELADLLRGEGIQVTQATVSRDIKEMQMVKAPTGDGRYRYAMPEERAGPPSERLLRVLRESVVQFDAGENIVVIQTLAATAQSVAEAIDMLHFDEAIGTLAGERTVFVVIRYKNSVPRFLDRLRELLG